MVNLVNLGYMECLRFRVYPKQKSFSSCLFGVAQLPNTYLKCLEYPETEFLKLVL